MRCKDALAYDALFGCAKAEQAHDAVMRHPTQNTQLTEVFVEGHQHTLLFVRSSKDGFISRIRMPVSGPENLVTSLMELLYRIH